MSPNRHAQEKHPAFSRIDHRPWPLPETPWVGRQSWCDLLFAHWPVKAEAIRHWVPASLQIQEFGGTSWIGLVPFRMTGVMFRPLPDLPWISAFPELNVRLYVERDGKPGVWFLSLDATNPLAIWAARRFFHLPYHRARMSVQQAAANRVDYVSERRTGDARFRGNYGPTGAVYESSPGTLDHFLTERYCLYAAAPDGALFRVDVHHLPWPLQAAEADIAENTMIECHGLSISGAPPLLHFARSVDVVVWPPKRLV